MKSKNPIKSNVLVIGGGGYVGTPLCEQLASCGHQVTSLDTFWFGHHHSPKIKSVTWDMAKSLTSDLPLDLNQFDTVIFLASISNDPSAELSHEFTRLINDRATKRMIDLIAQSKVKRFIYASSSSVYGIKEEERVTEELEVAPLTLYSELKYEIELYLQKWKDELDYVIVRPATVFGPSKRLRLDVVINILSAHAFYNHKIKIFGGQQYRPNIYIDDMVNFYQTLLEWEEPLQGEVYNFGGPNFKVKDLANMVAAQCPHSITQEVTPSNDDRSYRVCSDKAFKTFSLSALTPMEEGIAKLMNFFQENDLDWKSPIYSNMAHLKSWPEEKWQIQAES